jgi:hypothetical protein
VRLGCGNSMGSLIVFWYFIRDPFHFRKYLVNILNLKFSPSHIDKLKIVVNGSLNNSIINKSIYQIEFAFTRERILYIFIRRIIIEITTIPFEWGRFFHTIIIIEFLLARRSRISRLFFS